MIPYILKVPLIAMKRIAPVIVVILVASRLENHLMKEGDGNAFSKERQKKKKLSSVWHLLVKLEKKELESRSWDEKTSIILALCN